MTSCTCVLVLECWVYRRVKLFSKEQDHVRNKENHDVPPLPLEDLLLLQTYSQLQAEETIDQYVPNVVPVLEREARVQYFVIFDDISSSE